MKLAEASERAVLARLSRIEGQARGIARMVQEGRECMEVVRQLAAMRAALGKVAVTIIGENLEQCVRRGADAPDAEELRQAKLALLEFV